MMMSFIRDLHARVKHTNFTVMDKQSVVGHFVGKNIVTRAWWC